MTLPPLFLTGSRADQLCTLLCWSHLQPPRLYPYFSKLILEGPPGPQERKPQYLFAPANPQSCHQKCAWLLLNKDRETSVIITGQFWPLGKEASLLPGLQSAFGRLHAGWQSGWGFLAQRWTAWYHLMSPSDPGPVT